MQVVRFDDLLPAARRQDEPRRWLFVFANATLPPDGTPAQREAADRDGGDPVRPG